MSQFMSEQSPHDFIRDRLKMVIEATDGAQALTAFRTIFDPAVLLIVNGTTFDLQWFEEHVQLIPSRLQDVRVAVTHAAWDNDVLFERHTVHAVDRASGDPFSIEAIAAYTFTSEGKIVSQNEFISTIEGRYDGW